jgi:hypothetical protein
MVRRVVSGLVSTVGAEHQITVAEMRLIADD